MITYTNRRFRPSPGPCPAAPQGLTIENPSYLRYTARSERVCYGECSVQAERQGAESDGVGISQTIDRLGSVETRVATLEAQQNWLHLEQLRAEVGGMRETMQYLIDYLAERDGGGAE